MHGAEIASQLVHRSSHRWTHTAGRHRAWQLRSDGIDPGQPIGL